MPSYQTFLFFLFSSFLDLATASIAGITRNNQCKQPAWYQPIYNGLGARQENWDLFINGSLHSSTDKGPYSLPPGTTAFSHYHLPIHGAVSEKYTPLPFKDGMLPPKLPVLQIEYNVGEVDLWFDMSFIDCRNQETGSMQACVFADGGYLLEVHDDDDTNDADAGCRDLHCPGIPGAGAGGSGGGGGDGQAGSDMRCSYAYHEHGDLEGTIHCGGRPPLYDTVNITLTFCPSPEQIKRYEEERRGRWGTGTRRRAMWAF